MTASLGRIHSFESFGAVDGPGIRFVIFMQGCPMRCLYCHNPETWSYQGGQEYSVDQVLEKALRYQSYWKDRGGITVSGGEALLQLDFLIELFRKAKQKGIHTCLDTSGALYLKLDSSKLLELIQWTDLVLLDIKHIDERQHTNLTGHSNLPVLKFAQFLSDHGIPMWIRHVLVPGWTDREEDLVHLRAFIETLTTVEKVEVLPYHSMAIPKYEKLGLDYPLKDVEAPSQTSLTKAKEILER